MTSQFGYRLQSILAFIPKVSCLFPPLASGFVWRLGTPKFDASDVEKTNCPIDIAMNWG